MAKEVGGDFFDVIPFEIITLEKGTLGLLIADVSGKGVPAALFMALSRIVVRVNALWHRDPGKSDPMIQQYHNPGFKIRHVCHALFWSAERKGPDHDLCQCRPQPPVVFRSRDGTLEELHPPVLCSAQSRTGSIHPGPCPSVPAMSS